MTLESIAQRLIDRRDHAAVRSERLTQLVDAAPAADGELQEPALPAEFATKPAQRCDSRIPGSTHAAQPLGYRETGRLCGQLDRAVLIVRDSDAEHVGTSFHAPFPGQRANRIQDSLLAGAEPDSQKLCQTDRGKVGRCRYTGRAAGASPVRYHRHLGQASPDTHQNSLAPTRRLRLLAVPRPRSETRTRRASGTGELGQGGTIRWHRSRQ